MLQQGTAELQKSREDIERELETRRKEILVAAKEDAFRVRAEMEQEDREKRAELGRAERRLAQKEENLERRLDALNFEENALKQRGVEADRLREELTNLLVRQRTELERVALLSAEEARAQVLKSVEDESRMEAARLTRDIEEDAKREGERRARNIISLAIQRCSVEQTMQTTVSVVPLPSDDLKGRIIGREGRNIRAFETLTGVDVVIEGTGATPVLQQGRNGNSWAGQLTTSSPAVLRRRARSTLSPRARGRANAISDSVTAAPNSAASRLNGFVPTRVRGASTRRPRHASARDALAASWAGDREATETAGVGGGEYPPKRQIHPSQLVSLALVVLPYPPSERPLPAQ
jgi:predicted RNA-binding protein Jag